MIFKKQKNTNWGSNVITYPKIYTPKNQREIKEIINKNNNFVIQGNKRSFGDVALNKKKVISLKNFNKILFFDKKKGEIEVESGLLLKDLLSFIVPKGWFVPVTPGTKYVSIGGMVANNVIGKNTSNNQIKYHIKKIKLITPDKKNIICSTRINKKTFDLTVGGFGLSGFIIAVTLKLKKIYSKNIDQKIIEFKNFNEFYKLSKKNKNYEYSVCWIDNFNKNKIVGLYYLGNTSKNNKHISSENFIANKIGVLILIILRIINSNYYFPKIMNFVFRNYKKYFYNRLCHYNEFFYPQDNVPYWNKIYGRNGFIQVQFLISKRKLEKVLEEISDFFIANKIFSSFIILKKIKEKGKYLNFYGSGYSISFDFVINSKYKILRIFLNKLFKKHKLKVNLTKDLITEKNNAYNYKEFKKFKKDLLKVNKSRKINSLFSKRLKI